MLLKLEDIHEHPTILRPVNRESDAYMYLALSVKDHGVLMPILVRPSARGYEIIKGMHRYQAALDAKCIHIPARIVNMTDQQIMELQLITSLHGTETKPVQYACHLLRLCQYEPAITLTGMAKKLNYSPQWIRAILGFKRLHERVAFLVDNERICLMNAYYLTKLFPEEEQLHYLDKAQTLPEVEFGGYIQARVKELRDAKKKKYVGVATKRPCVAHVSREFFQDGKSDGTETEFIYEGDPITESLKGCTTIEEVRVVVQEPPRIDYYWVVTQVQLKDRVIV